MDLPPLHPILVNFTAALVPASFVSDALGRLLRKQSLTSAGWWLLFYAAVITPFTALAGWLWLGQMEGMDMPQMSIHKWLGTGLAIVFVPLVYWRWRLHRDARQPGWKYLSVAAAVVAAVAVQGHLGGMMTFGAEQSVAASPSVQAQTSAAVHRHQGAELKWQDQIDLKD